MNANKKVLWGVLFILSVVGIVATEIRLPRSGQFLTDIEALSSEVAKLANLSQFAQFINITNFLSNDGYLSSYVIRKYRIIR